MQKHIVTIIHLILIAILLVAGLLLLVDMHHVNQRCTQQEIFFWSGRTGSDSTREQAEFRKNGQVHA